MEGPLQMVIKGNLLDDLAVIWIGNEFKRSCQDKTMCFSKQGTWLRYISQVPYNEVGEYDWILVDGIWVEGMQTTSRNDP